MSTRRRFLTVSSAALAVSALPCKLLAQRPSLEVFSNGNLGAYSQGLLTLAMFQRLVGSDFRAFLEDGSVVTLTLLSVSDKTVSTATVKPSATVPVRAAASVFSQTQRSTMAGLASSAFDLHFSVSGPALDQRSYTLDHATLGRFVAFVVPGLPTSSGNSCSISFNYLAGDVIGAAPVKSPVLLHVPEIALPVGVSGSSEMNTPASANLPGLLHGGMR